VVSGKYPTLEGEKVALINLNLGLTCVENRQEIVGVFGWALEKFSLFFAFLGKFSD